MTLVSREKLAFRRRQHSCGAILANFL